MDFSIDESFERIHWAKRNKRSQQTKWGCLILCLYLSPNSANLVFCYSISVHYSYAIPIHSNESFFHGIVSWAYDITKLKLFVCLGVRACALFAAVQQTDMLLSVYSLQASHSTQHRSLHQMVIWIGGRITLRSSVTTQTVAFLFFTFRLLSWFDSREIVGS